MRHLNIISEMPAYPSISIVLIHVQSLLRKLAPTTKTFVKYRSSYIATCPILENDKNFWYIFPCVFSHQTGLAPTAVWSKALPLAVSPLPGLEPHMGHVRTLPVSVMRLVRRWHSIGNPDSSISYNCNMVKK